jgi:hypothetical protein
VLDVNTYNVHILQDAKASSGIEPLKKQVVLVFTAGNDSCDGDACQQVAQELKAHAHKCSAWLAGNGWANILAVSSH